MNILNEFKSFAMKGNVVDMAVGVIIGASFGKIVTSLVSDVIMPPLGLLIGGVNFTGLKVVLREAEGTATAVSLNYGAFLQSVFDFLIVAWAIFMAVKAMNTLRKSEAAVPPPPPPAPSKQELLLGEIRDLLKQR